MTTTTESSPKRSPFAGLHEQYGGQMVDFTGWSLPIRYGSILEEHEQVRTSGGFFDVSHMGRLRFRGKDAVRCLDRICTRQIQGMAPGLCRYSLVCNEQGGCRDDVLVTARLLGGSMPYMRLKHATHGARHGEGEEAI